MHHTINMSRRNNRKGRKSSKSDAKAAQFFKQMIVQCDDSHKASLERISKRYHDKTMEKLDTLATSSKQNQQLSNQKKQMDILKLIATPHKKLQDKAADATSKLVLANSKLANARLETRQLKAQLKAKVKAKVKKAKVKTEVLSGSPSSSSLSSSAGQIAHGVTRVNETEYKAEIRVDSVMHYLGTFSTLREAAIVR